MKLKGKPRLDPNVSVNWPSFIKIHKADLLQLRKEVPCTKDIWNERNGVSFRLHETAIKQESLYSHFSCPIIRSTYY